MEDDEDRKAILKRRARYVAMALAGMGSATQAACVPCLSPLVDAGDPTIDGAIDAGVDAARLDAVACLSPDGWVATDAPTADDVATPNDTGLDAASEDATASDASGDAP
jgi:hypothetical protein